MKKAVKIICIALAVIIVAGGAVTWSFLPHPLNYKIKDIQSVGSDVTVVDESEDTVTIQKKSAGEFKVLMFTDMHLDGKNETSKTTVTNLVNNITREKPDLVLLGGDNVTSGLNRVRCRQLGQIFENLGVYWGGVIGNHEGDNKYSVTRTEMVNIFSSYDKCLMRRGLEDVTGDCNYSINILNSEGKLIQTFFFVDTFDEMDEETRAKYGCTDEDSEYDGAKEDQVAWYSAKAAATKEQYGDYSGILLLHIPLPQYAEAAESGEFLYGDKLEGVCCSGFDSGLFDAIKASGTTKAVFCGHDHMNNFGVEKDGILLSYIEPSGYGSYTAGKKLGLDEKDWLQGCTQLLIADDGTFKQTQMRNAEYNLK